MKMLLDTSYLCYLGSYIFMKTGTYDKVML